MPKIRAVNENTFEVTVNEMVETRHKVHLDDGYYEKLTGKNIPKEELIKLSFEFLLARESNSMILKEFDLTEIERYFPTFPAEMKNRIK